MTHNSPLTGKGSILKGLGIGIAITIGASIGLFFLAGALTAEPVFLALLYIGLAQLLWMVPLVRTYWRRGEVETGKGILLMAAVVALLNAACWGLMANVRIAG